MCFHFFFRFFSCHTYWKYNFKNCTITAGIKKYKSVIKKKKHGDIVLLEKSKLNCIEMLIFKALIDSVISHDEFNLINNVLKE